MAVRLAAIGMGLAAMTTMAAASDVLNRCFEDAGQRYQISPILLWSIAKTESGFYAGAINRANDNGSYDIGLMQINSSWLPTLRRYGVAERQLMDPCVSIHVGAWILAQNIAKHGYTWKAVGAYNARSSDKQLRYATKVLKTAYRVAGGAEPPVIVHSTGRQPDAVVPRAVQVRVHG